MPDRPEGGEPIAVTDGRSGHDTSDLLGRAAAADRTDRTPEQRPELDEALLRDLRHQLGERHPEVASLVQRMIADRQHPLDVVRSLRDPARRQDAIDTISELADGQLLRGQGPADYLRTNPGRGPLFEPVPAEVNRTSAGESRKQAFIEQAKTVDPARQIGSRPDERQVEMVAAYQRELAGAVIHQVRDELVAAVSQIDGARISARVKQPEDILDKVGRMSEGTVGRPGRPGYQVGDVVDAAGLRVTVNTTEQLEEALASLKERFGVGDRGRILEVENMYASPKEHNPAYRVVPMVVATEVGAKPYNFELQLSTRRASVAADLEHNTIYKDHLRPSENEQARVRQMQAEAAALDQEETRSRWS